VLWSYSPVYFCLFFYNLSFSLFQKLGIFVCQGLKNVITLFTNLGFKIKQAKDINKFCYPTN